MASEKEKLRKDEYQKAVASYTLALKAFHKGEFQKAKELLEDFLEKYAPEIELADRARAYLDICRKQQKKEKIQLKTFEDFHEYAVFKINQGDYEEAIKLLEKALEMKPKEGKIFYLMADVYCLSGQIDLCLDYLKKAIQADGFFRILAQNEPDFDALKNDKKFRLITIMA